MNSLIPLAALLALLGTFSAQGAITYVDAVGGASGNTFRTSDGDTTAWFVSGTSDSATTWGNRAFANGGSIYEGRHETGGQVDVPITTQLSGLADGTYNVWVFYWVNGSQDWSILAGLESDESDQTLYDEDDSPATDSSTLSFTNSPMTSEDGTRFMYGANLGQATVSGGSVIDIFIESPGSGLSGTNRTWYDGVGYELVPEPSVALLTLLGSMVLLRRRRD